MKINQYQTVFLLAALLLGYWVYSDLQTQRNRSGTRRGDVDELVRYPIPSLKVLPSRDVDVANWPRDLFSAPRDTEPLTPLLFEPPPVELAMVLAPPGLGGPIASQFAPHLRRQPIDETAATLFADEAIDVLQGFQGLPAAMDQAKAEELMAQAEVDLSLAVEMLETIDTDEAREALVQIRTSLQGSGLELDLPELSASEKISSYRKLHDWIQMPSLLFGRIANADRYRLSENTEEPLLFVEFNPETGQEKYPGQPPIPFDRERISDFGFAETTANSLELARVALGDTITPATQVKALELAQRCMAVYTEAPAALAMARELCEQVVGLEQGQHLEGRLLLARLFEAEFDFESAFGVYESLLSGPDYSNRPEALVAAGRLHFRLGVWDRAETYFRRAVESERSDAEAQLALGQLLLTKGEAQEALQHLELAEQFEPRGLENKGRRLAMRTEHGMGLLGLGRGKAAMEAFQRALALDVLHPSARAGLVEAARLLPPDQREAALNKAQAALDRGLVQADFGLALAQGLLAIEMGDWFRARSILEAAATVDPFEAHLAYGALAFLAEQTGYLDRAMTFLDQALEIRPGFTWAHYTRGRILLQQDDLAGAEEALREALKLELDFPDALVIMAEVERARSDFVAANLYLERALQREPNNAAWLTMAGFNAYSLGNADTGRQMFQKALEQKGDLASAGLSEAWWHYMGGDSLEAINRLSEWAERRRNEGEDDPYVLYAEEQSNRIRDHDSKELWTDRFERRPGRIGNGWSVKEGIGPIIELQDGSVHMKGLFTGAGRTRIYNELAADSFLSLEARVSIGPEHRGSDVGLFLSRERVGNSGSVVVQSEVVFQRNADGQLQYLVVRRGEEDSQPIDIPGATLASGSDSIWTLEKVGVGSDAYIRLFLDGEPVVERIPMPTLGTSTQVLRFGLLIEGQSNRSADVTLDDVRVVRRQR